MSDSITLNKASAAVNLIPQGEIAAARQLRKRAASLFARSSVSHAILLPRAAKRSQSWVMVLVLPKPAGALTSSNGTGPAAATFDQSVARGTSFRGAAGGVTFAFGMNERCGKPSKPSPGSIAGGDDLANLTMKEPSREHYLRDRCPTSPRRV